MRPSQDVSSPVGCCLPDATSVADRPPRKKLRVLTGIGQPNTTYRPVSDGLIAQEAYLNILFFLPFNFSSGVVLILGSIRTKTRRHLLFGDNRYWSFGRHTRVALSLRATYQVVPSSWLLPWSSNIALRTSVL